MCNALVNDNETLSAKVTSLTTTLSKRSWEFYTAKLTLLIGDSLIRNVDENKLHNTIVRSMSGPTIGDVHDELSTDDKLYKKFFVCAGIRIRIRISLFQDIQTLTYKEQNEA